MDTATLADFGITINASQTKPSKFGKSPRPVWEVYGMIEGYEDILYSLGGKKWHGRFSFWDDPTEEILAAILEQGGRTSFAERMEGKRDRAAERAERYSNRAKAADNRSDTYHKRFQAILAPIPLGQPILVGHHSEKRHRKAISTAEKALGNAVTETKKADYYRNRAMAANNTASDKSVPFMARRLKEAETELRRLRREIAEIDVKQDGATPEVHVRLENWRGKLSIMIREQEERVGYWTNEIEAAGGIPFAPSVAKENSIAKGDYVYDGRCWCQVIRVNAKTVSAQCVESWGAHYTPKIPYATIKKVITAAEYETRKQRNDIRININHARSYS